MVGIVPVLIYSRFNTFLFQGPNSWAKDSRASDIWAQPSAQKKWTGPKCPGLNLPIIPGNNNNISFPFPKVLNGIFHSRSRPQKLGKEFSFPFPKVGNTIFHSRSRSQKLGMQFIVPVPVPKVWEWAEPFPFPFPNVQKSFPLTPGLYYFGNAYFCMGGLMAG